MDDVLNKTISPGDLQLPAVAPVARRLSRYALSLYLHRTPFAVNGVLRRRWRVRWHKLWEYARGLAYGDMRAGQRVLDFGGGATLPVFYLAQQGCEVISLDIDERLTAHANRIAARRRWSLHGSTLDLACAPPPSEWGLFDRVMSFCVLEHLPQEAQPATVAQLAALLKPGGIFALTFDFGEQAPVEGAVRSVAGVRALSEASGLQPLGNGDFVDTGERFRLDKNYPDRLFTFGSLFLQKVRQVHASRLTPHI